MIAYLIEGAVGLPFFAPGGAPGILRFFGPTGGYLVAFPAAAFITGAFAEHGWDKRYPTAVAAMAIGSAIILLGGWAWYCDSHEHAAGDGFQDRRVAVSRRRRDQDRAWRGGASDGLGVAQA